MFLSYSGFKQYQKCNFAYWNSYINNTVLSEPNDRLGSIYGTIVGKIFETFYATQAWKQLDPQKFLLDLVDEIVSSVIREETSDKGHKKAGVLMWKGTGPGQNPAGMYTDRAELTEDVNAGVIRGLRIIKYHRLVGPRTDAELKLDYEFEGNKYGGRADFVIQRLKPFSDLLIVDGKGSKHLGRYVDPQQLKWYGMLFWLHALEKGGPLIPDKTAFLYWKAEPEKAMDWLTFSQDDFKGFFEEVQDTVKEIIKFEKMVLPNSPVAAARGVFKPKANEDNCRFCPYSSGCPQGAKVKAQIETQAQVKRDRKS